MTQGQPRPQRPRCTPLRTQRALNQPDAQPHHPHCHHHGDGITITIIIIVAIITITIIYTSITSLKKSVGDRVFEELNRLCRKRCRLVTSKAWSVGCYVYVDDDVNDDDDDNIDVNNDDDDLISGQTFGLLW